MQYMEDALEFLAQELSSEAVEKELIKMSSVFPWIDDDTSATYFELAISFLPECMQKVRLMASKTYARGLVIISIYFDSHIYCVLQSGEGEQPLLDVRFPDVSKHNQGIMLNSYSQGGFRKLNLWHNISSVNISPSQLLVKKELPKLKTIDLSTVNYEQTYVILQSAYESTTPTDATEDSAIASNYHDALFRFGSWCYSGRVQLTAHLSLMDVPYVIPALRMQQSRLDYVSDVTALPVTSPFAHVLQYMRQVSGK
jgi:hypothetical protein